MSRTKDGLVCGHTSWVCTSESDFSDVITTQRYDEEEDEAQLTSATCKVVHLERVEENAPCIITLLCSPESGAEITNVSVVSEARTVEVYSLSGDYCGTGRGAEVHSDSSEEKRTFYRTLVALESPVASCEIKLLSLGGRSAVGIARVRVVLRFRRSAPCPTGINPGIDLQRVRTMMEEMGTSLSPGAQNLMEMVQHQQQNKVDVLGGLLPLLMAGGAAMTTASTVATAPSGEFESDVPSEQSPGPPGLLTAQVGQLNPVCPGLLPMLQSVCGQVTQLRLDAAATSPERRNGEREAHVCCGGLEKALESVVERRMEELERRLMEHVDVRLDALQRKLELTIQQAFAHTPNPE